MPWDGQLSSWFRSGEALRTVTGYNVHEAQLFDKRQYGGTFALCFRESASRVIESGSDKAGLGRWSWFRFNNRNQASVRIVVAYRPIRTGRDQLLSTYMQQSRYLSQNRDQTCPRRAFFRDLASELATWIALGDRIILAGDLNERADHPDIVQFFASFEMRDVLSERHSPCLPHSTFLRGSTIIDSVWASLSLSAEAGSWLSFDMSVADHRSLILDFDSQKLFGSSSLCIPSFQGRRLNSRLPSVRATYVRLLEKFLIQAQFPHRCSYLCTHDWSLQPPSALHSYLDTLDRLRAEGMRFAEKRCRRFHSGAVFFSPVVNHARNVRELYHLVLQQLSGHRRRSRSRITKLARRCGILDACQLSLEEARLRFTQADMHYRSLKPRSATLRETFLQYKLQDLSLSSRDVKAITTLIRTESLRTTFRYLRHIEGAVRGGSVSEVQENIGTDSSPILLSHLDRIPVETALTSALRQRFSLAHATPLLQPSVVHRLGLLGWSPDAQSLLSGNFEYDALPVPAHTRLFLQGLCRPTDGSAPPPVSTSISRQDFVRYWRKAKENTSSSFSGLHFGHYKAATYSPMLSEVHALITETAFRAGYPLLRWRHGLQVILEKKPGVRLVTKLRAILLMEADFNFANKLLVGYRMMRGACMHPHAVPQELYGGLKGRRADLLALTRRLLTDILRQSRRPAAIASIDAESCYDRISHTAASLACQRWGVPPAVMVTMLLAIQNMQFHLRTAFGDSLSSYGSSGETVFQGICQGNGAGPAVWLAISTCLVQILKAACPVQHPLTGPLSRTSLALSGLLFVDDTDILCIGASPSTSTNSVISTLQRHVDLWSGILQASGGAINPGKSSWSLLSFLPDFPSLRFHTKSTAPGSLSLPNPLNPGCPATITRLEPWESSKVVGVVQASNGAMTGQLKELHRISSTWASNLARHCFPRHLAWVALRTKIWATLRYPLSCTTITKKEGHALVSRLYQQVLPKLGATRSLPNAYKYGPACCQGLGLPHPYYFQGGQQVSTFAHLLRSDHPEGLAMRISWEYLQLQLGVDTPFLSLPFSQWGPLASPCWLTSLWEFVSEFDIAFDGLPPLFPPLPRFNDRYIMEVLVTEASLPISTLRACNRVRIGLHLLSLTDITTGDGSRIRSEYFFGRSSAPSPSISTYDWPPSPFSAADARLWTDTMLSLFGQGLPSFLGPWTREPHISYWEWWVDETFSFLFRFQRPSIWTRFHLRVGSRTRRSTYYLHSVLPSSSAPPPGSLRATAKLISPTRAIFEGCSPLHRGRTGPVYPPTPEDCLSFADYIECLSSRSHWALAVSDFPCPEQITQAITVGSAVGVCDGSYMPHLDSTRASAAWIVVDALCPIARCCSGCTLVNGPPAFVNSYRAELQGLHTLLLALDTLCTYYSITHGSIHLFCDNLKVVELADLPLHSLRPNLAHLDLLRAICSVRSTLPITVQLSHVTGHQDDVALPEALPLEARLNIWCDKTAKRHLLDCIHRQLPPPSPMVHGEGVRVIIDGDKVTSDLHQAVMTRAAFLAFREFVLQKLIFTPASFTWVNWAAIGVVFSGLSTAFRLWAVKFVSGFSGTGVRMHQWGLWPSPLCPCCNLAPETTVHLLTCSAPALVSARQAGLDRLTTWLTTWNTHPYLSLAIQALCHEVPSLPPAGVTPLDPTTTAIHLAFARQLSLGPTQFWFGRHIVDWECIQGNFYRSCSDRRTGRQWATGLITRVIEIAHDIWIARNDIVHSHSLRGLNIREAESLAADIREQYDLATQNLLAADRHLILARSLDTILSLPAAQKRIWLATVRLAREEGARSLQSDMVNMAHLMQNWLRR